MNQIKRKSGNPGTPRVHPLLKKTLRNTRLPEWLWRWLDVQPGTNRALLIEDALREKYHCRFDEERGATEIDPNQGLPSEFVRGCRRAIAEGEAGEAEPCERRPGNDGLL
jgi:hypothetical protein